MTDGTAIAAAQNGNLSGDRYREVIDPMVDVARDETDLQVDTNEDFELLTETLGSGTFVNGYTRDPFKAEYADADHGEFPDTIAGAE